MYRRIIIFVLVIAILGHLKAENVRLSRELHNLRGVVRDQALTVQHLTHPDTVQRRTIDWILRQGEFGGRGP